MLRDVDAVFSSPTVPLAFDRQDGLTIARSDRRRDPRSARSDAGESSEHVLALRHLITFFLYAEPYPVGRTRMPDAYTCSTARVALLAIRTANGTISETTWAPPPAPRRRRRPTYRPPPTRVCVRTCRRGPPRYATHPVGKTRLTSARSRPSIRVAKRRCTVWTVPILHAPGSHPFFPP